MRCLLGLFSLILLSPFAETAPIPKSLKAKKSYSFDGIWEQVGSNVNGQDGQMTHRKYWKLEKDTFWYSMPTTDPKDGGSKSVITTPDESQPQYKNYTSSRCLLELEDDDTLKWIFANDKNDKLEKCEPGPDRSLYTFKRVK
jgi:hypothetical protein